jgi:tetratricopeptide (TPR) repeat protein
MSASTSPPAPSRRWLFPVAFLVVAGVCVAVWYMFRPTIRPNPDPDPVAAAHANARGIGHIEQFNNAEAVNAFEEAMKLAPDWTPAKINLGIALLNSQAPENLDRALKLFGEVIAKEPDNAHAHYCSGIIFFHKSSLPEAAKHFEEVNRIDPNDASAWYWRGRCVPDSPEAAEAMKYFEKALKLNPYLNAARYGIAQHRLLADNEIRKKQLLEDFEALRLANAMDLLDIKYTEMGRYGEVIGKSPAPAPAVGPMPMFDPVKKLAVKLADGTTWASRDKTDDLRKAIRNRFGGAILLLDHNRDGKPDILLLGAVLRGGEVRDLLLRNDGDFSLTDVTADAGLANHAANLGGAVGDYDNDGFPDLALAGPGGVKLFRNNSGKGFEDKTAAAGLDKTPGFFLTAAWVDLDQDGDIDLVLAKYAQDAPRAVKQLRGEKGDPGGSLVAFANTGVAPPTPRNQPTAPLSTAFKEVTESDELLVSGPVSGIIAIDVDADFDVDLLVLVDGQPPVTVFNDRLLRFHHRESVTTLAGRWSGGVVLDANGDDQSDLVFVDSGASPLILLSKRDDPGVSIGDRFARGAISSPHLKSALWCDLDLDGRTDIIGLSIERKPVFLQGDGTGKFRSKDKPFGPDADAIPELLAVASVDLDGDHVPDLFAWSESAGLRVHRSLGNGNSGLKLTLTGMRKPIMPGEEGKPLRTNADGVGAFVRIHTGPLRTAAENTTQFAGLGQSRLPLHFGIGKSDAAEVVRVRWPDGVTQAELNKGAGAVTIAELDRKPSSCPILFTWDGERFAYITDFLGAGAVGETGPDGSVRPPRPEESIKIEPGRLAPRNGKFVLKIGEPMDEVMYLDRLRLDVIDHPADVSVFPDERFATSDPQPTQERLFFRDSERIFSAKATDHRGRDLTAVLSDRDGKNADGFAVRSWLGFAEDHFVELDFNGRLRSLPAGLKVYLVLAGWTDYAFPESIYAATQAGVPPVWPVLEQKQANGTWKALGEVGLPAGLTRVMTKEITGWIDPAGGPVRIRTNLQIYWDQVFIAPVAAAPERDVHELAVSKASLEHRGFTQEYRPNGKLPIAYDYDRLEAVSVTRWRGRLTRTGDVTDLLTADDDRHVICGPGDELTAEFDAAALPPLKPGWTRSFVLRSWGYCKDAAPTTQTGGTVGPLPHRGMPHYPYNPSKEPLPTALVEYDRIWNTRLTGRR